jgi:hypothetical protein
MTRKMKERRRRNEWALVERRKGALWMYAQIPFLAALAAYFISVVR